MVIGIDPHQKVPDGTKTSLVLDSQHGITVHDLVLLAAAINASSSGGMAWERRYSGAPHRHCQAQPAPQLENRQDVEQLKKRQPPPDLPVRRFRSFVLSCLS